MSTQYSFVQSHHGNVLDKSTSRSLLTRSNNTSNEDKVPRSQARSSDQERMYEPFKTTLEGFPVNNKLKTGKYATSIDDRGYLSGRTSPELTDIVYEFSLNDQTIMWDYCTGLVHLTGIWKALGNSKADIVRLVDNHPELEGVIRRIRGGFLKVQGTWVPFELCKKLALRTCYTIRHALISVFGPDFPGQCLKPDVRGYGTLTLDDSGIDNKKRKRKKVESVPQPATRKLSEREKRPRLEASDRTSTIASDASVCSETKMTPPPMPRVIDVAISRPSTAELLDLLRASRSLQKISMGSDASWDPEGNEAYGGEFDLSGTGTTFHWDGMMVGNRGLDVIGSEHGESTDSPIQQPLSMSRKFSATPSTSTECGAITPPNSFVVAHVGMGPVPASTIGRGHWSPPEKIARYTYSSSPKNTLQTSGIDILSSW